MKGQEVGRTEGFEGSERRPTGGKTSATIVVRSDSERVADPEPTIGGEGRRSLSSAFRFYRGFFQKRLDKAKIIVYTYT